MHFLEDVKQINGQYCQLVEINPTGLAGPDFKKSSYFIYLEKYWRVLSTGRTEVSLGGTGLRQFCSQSAIDRTGLKTI